MIVLKKIKKPEYEEDIKPVLISDETIKDRFDKVIKKMMDGLFDILVIYADLEHGGNFEYLTGFLPRFEEALLVIHKDKTAYMILGNENLNKCSKSRIKCLPIHMPHFSLPNQPMDNKESVFEILSKAKLDRANKIGLVGWKNILSAKEDSKELFDIPHFIVENIKKVNSKAKILNATDLFIGEDGVRTVNNANEVAHYEFGAALAGNCMLKAMDNIAPEKSEMEIASFLDAYGQDHNVVSIMATGERFEKANMYPTDKKIKAGDAISITTGFKGGLQSRAGYAVKCADQLDDKVKDYLDVLAIPYFKAVKTWLENIRIGMKGGELYDLIESVLPKKIYNWSLNPGHLCADEEWLSSPIYKGSKETIKSGMLLQIDIIPSKKGYAGISCESGIFMADETLRNEIRTQYPQMQKRIEKRREYIVKTLGINLSKEVMPTSGMVAYCRPFLLNYDEALISEAD